MKEIFVDITLISCVVNIIIYKNLFRNVGGENLFNIKVHVFVITFAWILVKMRFINSAVLLIISSGIPPFLSLLEKSALWDGLFFVLLSQLIAIPFLITRAAIKNKRLAQKIMVNDFFLVSCVMWCHLILTRFIFIGYDEILIKIESIIQIVLISKDLYRSLKRKIKV